MTFLKTTKEKPYFCYGHERNYTYVWTVREFEFQKTHPYNRTRDKDKALLKTR